MRPCPRVVMAATIKVAVQVSGTVESVLLAFPSGGAAFLYDQSTFRSPASYLISDGHQAVRLEGCGSRSGFCNGGFIVETPQCADLRIYEETFASEPHKARIGLGIGCDDS